MNVLEPKLVEQLQKWVATDPEQRWVDQLNVLAESNERQDHEKLRALFDGRIGFGTAGLRSKVGPGPKNMNAQVVRQTTAGLMNWIKKYGPALTRSESLTEQGTTSGPIRITIGFDARHDSALFAQHCAATVKAMGGEFLLADKPAATPICAYAGLAHNSDATVVITASHNPKDDNGYKLYMSDGIQLISPTDSQIVEEIESVIEIWPEIDAEISKIYVTRDQWRLCDAELWTQQHREAFLKTFDEIAPGANQKEIRKDLVVAYSAMHGVGNEAIAQAFIEAGFAKPHSVSEQAQPDPDFPTVNFPNPEEDGAIDMAVKLGNEIDADVILVNDPDADRLAAAIKSRDGSRYVMLSGNELATLLADYLLNVTDNISKRVVARSVVSSRQLDHMASSHGVDCVVALTGFKWVARPIVEEPERQYIFGFEEAIGYCVSAHVRDKDGISAAVIAAQAVAELKADSKTVWDRFDEIALQHGVFESSQIVIRFDSSEKLAAVVEGIKTNGVESVAGSKVSQFGDLGLGTLPPSTGLHMVTECDTQIIIRPSGTEPKIKTYLEVFEPIDNGSVTEVRQRALQRLRTVESSIEEVLNSAI